MFNTEGTDDTEAGKKRTLRIQDPNPLFSVLCVLCVLCAYMPSPLAARFVALKRGVARLT
jgi:hypothetical protein